VATHTLHHNGVLRSEHVYSDVERLCIPVHLVAFRCAIGYVNLKINYLLIAHRKML